MRDFKHVVSNGMFKNGKSDFFDDGSLIEQSGSKNTVSPIAGRYSISDSTQSGDVVTTVKFDDKVKEWVYGGVERLLQRNH